MKKLLAILFLSSLPGIAQSLVVTPSCNGAASVCTSSQITESVRVWPAYNANFSVPPSQQTIALTNGGGGTLTWTAALTGACNTAGAFGGPLMTVTQQYSGVPFLSGTAPSVIKLNWNATYYFTPTPAVGVVGCTLTITPSAGSPQVITITLNVLAASYGQETNTPIAAPSGCSDNSPNTSYPAQCAVVSEGTLAIPAINSTQTDTNFGGSYKRCTPVGLVIAYGSNTPFSGSNSYILVGSLSGGLYIYDTATCSQYRDITGHGGLDSATMYPLDDTSLTYFTGATIHKYDWVANSDTTLGDFTSLGFTDLFAGGSQQISNDGWISFYERATSNKVCAVNLPQLITDGAVADTNTYCGNTPATQTSIDWTGVWAMDTVASKRFVMVQGDFSSILYVDTPGVLSNWILSLAQPGYDGNDDSYPFASPPQSKGYGGDFAHSAMYVDATGNARLFNLFGTVRGGQSNVASFQVGKRSLMMRPIEEGGGMLLTQIMGILDIQPGCADRIGCIMTPFDGSGTPSGGFPATQVLSATAANPVIAVTATPHGYTVGTHKIRIDGSAGGTFAGCLDGIYDTATIVDTTTISVPTDCTGAGTYTANSANQGDAALSIPASPVPNWSEAIFLNPQHTVTQVMMTRAIDWTDVPAAGINAYYSQPKGGLSRNGAFTAFNSNWGFVAPTAVYIATIPQPAPETPGSLFSGKVTLTGNTTLR